MTRRGGFVSLSWVFLALVAGAACLSSAAAAEKPEKRTETFDEVKKKIHERVSRYTTLEYELEIVSEMVTKSMYARNVTKQTGHFKQSGQMLLWRIESKSKSVQKVGDRDQEMENYSLDVGDGKFSYLLVEMGQNKTATRRNVDLSKRTNPFDALHHFAMLSESFDLSLLGSDTVDGKDAWVIEIRPRPDAESGVTPPGHSVAYYDKKTGLNFKSVSFDKKGNPRSTMTTSVFRINKPIDESNFVFEVPEGARFNDLTDRP